MRPRTSRMTRGRLVLIVAGLIGVSFFARALAQESEKKKSSYMPVDINEDFASILARMKKAKPEVMKRQMDLLNERYDLSDHLAKGVTMSRGKPIQEGVRVRLPKDMTWEKLAAMSPEEIQEKGLFPEGFLPPNP